MRKRKGKNYTLKKYDKRFALHMHRFVLLDYC